MEQERAMEIIESITSSEYGWAGRIDKFFQPGEKEEVMKVWSLMPGHTSFFNALHNIAHNIMPYGLSEEKRNGLISMAKTGKWQVRYLSNQFGISDSAVINICVRHGFVPPRIIDGEQEEMICCCCGVS